jgi:hypothetical protein
MRHFIVWWNMWRQQSDIFSMTAEIDIILTLMFVNLKDNTTAVKTQHTSSL